MTVEGNVMGINASVIALVLLGTTVTEQNAQPTRKDVQAAISAQPYDSYAEGDILAWRRDLQEALKHTTVDAAADALANRYGFADGDMRRLVRAWIVSQSRQYDPDHGWVQGIRAELYALAPVVRAKPLGLGILAEALDATTEACSAADFDMLITGSVDPAADGYVIASTLTCSGNFARAALAGGDRAVPALIRAAEYGGLPPRDALPLYAWLTSPTALAHVRVEDRAAVSTILWQRYLTALFAADLGDRALAAFDSLPADLRAAVISPRPRPEIHATIDRISMTFAGEGKDDSAMTMTVALDDEADAMSDTATKSAAVAPSKPEPIQPESRNLGSLDAPILQVAESMAIAGRSEEARKVLATLPGLADARASLLCQYKDTSTTKSPCARGDRLPMGALPLDHLLNAADADPYPIAETTLAGAGGLGRSASGAVLCRVFPKGDYPDVCPDAAGDAYFDQTIDKVEELAADEAALAHVVPNFAVLRASILGARAATAQSGAKRGERRRATVAAITPDFPEKPIPAAYLGAAPSLVLKGLAPLPPGYILVRAERAGGRVIAISVSQTYDPTGEVSQGGYWIHLSQDGGRHWESPLYTGLADRFPYVVASSSRLPLVAGDTLQLAVDVSEIDTASISYPPVGLRHRRQAKDRFLTISLAALRRDSDADGLTDIAAHHLLLDRPKSDGEFPFVVGSDDAANCHVAPSADKLALIDLLGKVVGASGAAIVEPVDRSAGEWGAGVRRAAAATDQPLFLLGRRQDYTCLRSRRLIIVYDHAEIDALNRFTPDFHALEVPRIIFNRAHDRGYVRWSTGWAGGTYRLRRVGQQWQFDTISSWIT
jgi:hypothetical protein